MLICVHLVYLERKSGYFTVDYWRTSLFFSNVNNSILLNLILLLFISGKEEKGEKNIHYDSKLQHRETALETCHQNHNSSSFPLSC